MDRLIPARNARAGETLLFAFLATVVMLFAGFTSAWLIRRTGSDWGRLDLPLLVYANTLALALSSVTLEGARRRGARGRPWMWATLTLGVLFLAGQLALWQELSRDGRLVTDTPQGAFLVLLSAVHGLHLLGGLVTLGWLLHRHATARLAAVYWHFLGLTWIYVLCLLRLS